MSIQKNNVVMHGNSGKFANQVVFRIRAGKTILCAPPRINENRVPTAGQQVILDKFAKAITYAKAALKVQATKDAYNAAALPGQSGYNRAVADAFTPPVVLSIDKQNYKGLSSDTIMVQATDDFKVASVKVSIHTAAGELVEEGLAQVQEDGLSWLFTPTMENEEATGSKIKATAYDLPGNDGSLEITV